MPDAVWHGIDEDWKGLVENRAPGAIEDLVAEVQKVLVVYRAGQADPLPIGVPHSRARRAQGPQADLRESEKQRAEVVARVVAGLARQDTDVQDFRRRYLGGELLAPKDIPELMASAVLRVLPWERLDKLGIPVLGHRVRPTIFRRPGPPGEGQVKVRGVQVSWGKEAVNLRLPPVILFPNGRRAPSLMCGPHGTPPKMVVPRPDSFLDDVRFLAARLAHRYSWPEPEAAWFLLTDEPPPYEPVLIDLMASSPPSHPDGQIVLRLRPWVSEQAIRRAYKACQRILLGHRKREITMAKLALFEFVETRMPPPPAHPNWPDLFRQWQGTRTRRNKPPTTWRHFRLAYLRLKRLLLGPVP